MAKLLSTPRSLILWTPISYQIVLTTFKKEIPDQNRMTRREISTKISTERCKQYAIGCSPKAKPIKTYTQMRKQPFKRREISSLDIEP